MRILLDCDVLIDVGSNRMPHVGDSQRVLDWCQAHAGSGCIAWHSIANFYYLLGRHGGGAAARQFITDLLDFVEVVPTGTPAAKHALALPMVDFEDGMQCAAAVQAGADLIVTRNIADYRAGPIPAVLPTEFLTQAPP